MRNGVVDAGRGQPRLDYSRHGHAPVAVGRAVALGWFSVLVCVRRSCISPSNRRPLARAARSPPSPRPAPPLLQGFVHCDLKPENVLLKEANNRRGFTAKVDHAGSTPCW